LDEPAQKALEAKTAAERAAETAERAAERAKTTLQRVSDDIPPLEQAVAQRTTEHQQSEERLAESQQQVAAGEIPFRRVAFSPDNVTLAASGDDGVVRLFDVSSCAPLNQYKAAAERAVPLAFLSGVQLIAGSDEGVARVWGVEPRWELER